MGELGAHGVLERQLPLPVNRGAVEPHAHLREPAQLAGEILGGGNKGGLIGVTFRLVGPLDNPQIVVNPMSAIAPGIFRRIFEFR